MEGRQQGKVVVVVVMGVVVGKFQGLLLGLHTKMITDNSNSTDTRNLEIVLFCSAPMLPHPSSSLP